MLILPTTTDTLELVLGSAQTSAAMHVLVSWRDITTSAFTPGETASASDGTTPVTICAAPDASTQRVIDFVSVYNNDTAAKQVTVRRALTGGVTRIAISVSLGVRETLLYLDSVGWQVLTSNGSVKQAQVQGSNQVTNNRQVVVLGSDVTNNNATANTIADVTGLSFPVVSGKIYWFRFVIDFTAAATTTGARFAVNGPTFSRLSYRTGLALAAALGTDGESTSFNVAYDTPAGVTATSGNTGGNIATIEGFITPTADGTVIARFASEVSSSAIVAKAGSIVEYQQLN